jgi:hypothetical protein
MAPPTKRKKHLKQNSLAVAADIKLVKQAERRRETLVTKWKRIFENFTSKKDSLTNPSGKARSFEENKMILLALRGSVKLHLKMIELGVQDSINWTAI